MTSDLKSYITKEIIEEFTLDSVAEIKEKENHMYVKFYSHGMGPSPEFNVTEYTFKGINAYRSFDYSSEWRTFMLRILNSDLRKKYIKVYNEHLDSLKLSDENVEIY